MSNGDRTPPAAWQRLTITTVDTNPFHPKWSIANMNKYSQSVRPIISRKTKKHLIHSTISAAIVAGALAGLANTASAACNGCTISVPDGRLPARAYGEAIGGAVGGMVGGVVGAAAGAAVGGAAAGGPGGVGGSIVGSAAGTAAGDHAGTFYGGAVGGAVDHLSGRK
jgi:hypothetical protein